MITGCFRSSRAWRLQTASALLLTATLYPWYLLWVLPWAAVTRHRAWIALSASSLLCYVPQVYDVPYLPWVFLAVWAPFWVLFWRSRWRTD